MSKLNYIIFFKCILFINHYLFLMVLKRQRDTQFYLKTIKFKSIKIWRDTFTSYNLKQAYKGSFKISYMVILCDKRWGRV